MPNTRVSRFGLWLIGAGGAVGATVALGIAALSKRLIDTTGLVTALPQFSHLDLIDPSHIVIGGHEIRTTTLQESLRDLQSSSGIVPDRLLEQCSSALDQTQARIKPGIMCGPIPTRTDAPVSTHVQRADTPADLIEHVTADLNAFRLDNNLAHVVVVNVASCEPAFEPHPAHRDWPTLQQAMNRPDCTLLPASSVYALGALAANCSYINFTPSTGMSLPAIEQFARSRDVLHMGRDGKTGETLLKSVLAPMFAGRNLRIRSWVGHNVLGNDDGRTLADPAVKASKLRSKDAVLPAVLGYEPVTRTTIEYVPSLGDWKTAWDLVHFEGFFATQMRLELTWTGSDSMLAAPLIIDLARLTHLEHARGRRGPMPHLACFFKDPDGVADRSHFTQWESLLEHVTTRVDPPK